jgi:hypothetical protein
MYQIHPVAADGGAEPLLRVLEIGDMTHEDLLAAIQDAAEARDAR